MDTGDSNSQNKRQDNDRYIRNVLYPQYRKETIKDKCIVFESFWGRRYGCNPAALYEYINENFPEYECIWLLNDTDVRIKGTAKKVQRGTKEHFFYLATAKYFVFNNNMPRSFKKRPGQIIIHTMHGTPFKTYGLDVKEETENEEDRVRVVERSSMWDYLIVQGEFSTDMVWKWFRYNKRILKTGYPRTDALYKEDSPKYMKLKTTLGIPLDKKVMLYAPTWRSMSTFEMKIDLNSMRKSLSDEYILMIRLHHFEVDFYDVPEDGSFIFDAGKVATIEELYPLTDILITDYSSVMFDFALTQKPMIFYAYDLEEYTQNERGSYFDISTEAPGPVVKTTSELISTIVNIDEEVKSIKPRINKFRERYLTYENSDSCKKVFNEVFLDKGHLSYRTVNEVVVSVLEHLMPHRIYSKIKRIYIREILKRE